jgi:hypothetical protein
MSTRPLARLGVGLALVAMLVLFSGCVKQKEESKITKAGSGTAKMTATLDLSHMKEMMEMMAGMGMANPNDVDKDPAEQLDIEEAKKKIEEAEGVKLVSAKREIAEDKSSASMIIEIEFDSLKHLYEADIVQGVKASLHKRPDGNYELNRMMFADMIPDAGGDPEAAGMMEMMMGMFEPYMADMVLETVLTLPTAIVETNGTQGTGNTVTWKLGFKDIQSSEKRRQKVVFSGAGLEWADFGTPPKATPTAEPTVTEPDEPAPEKEEPKEAPEPAEAPGK